MLMGVGVHCYVIFQIVNLNFFNENGTYNKLKVQKCGSYRFQIPVLKIAKK